MQNPKHEPFAFGTSVGSSLLTMLSRLVHNDLQGYINRVDGRVYLESIHVDNTESITSSQPFILGSQPLVFLTKRFEVTQILFHQRPEIVLSQSSSAVALERQVGQTFIVRLIFTKSKCIALNSSLCSSSLSSSASLTTALTSSCA